MYSWILRRYRAGGTHIVTPAKRRIAIKEHSREAEHFAGGIDFFSGRDSMVFSHLYLVGIGFLFRQAPCTGRIFRRLAASVSAGASSALARRNGTRGFRLVLASREEGTLRRIFGELALLAMLDS